MLAGIPEKILRNNLFKDYIKVDWKPFNSKWNLKLESSNKYIPRYSTVSAKYHANINFKWLEIKF